MPKNLILKNVYRNGSKVPMMVRNGELIYKMVTRLVFSVDTNSLSFDPTGETKTITITANDDWTMTVPEWITASALSGTTGTSVTLTASSTETDKSGSVVITCGGKVHTIAVEQVVYHYFRITNRTNTQGTVTLKKTGSTTNLVLRTRTSGGSWGNDTTYSATATFTLPANGYIEFYGPNNPYWNGVSSTSVYWSFVADVEFDVSGDLMSLVSGSSITRDYEFLGIFIDSTNLINASGLTLPNNVRTQCFRSMFNRCYNLESAPVLPATTLADYCYYYMFQSCRKLTRAPELPALTLVSNCYNSMFNDCTTLNYVKCLATNISASSSHNNWLNGVQTTSGTFVKNPNISTSTWGRGISGIPQNWTVEDADI